MPSQAKKHALLATGLLIALPAHAHDSSSLPYAIATVIAVQAIPGLWVIGWKIRRLIVYYFAALVVSWPLLFVVALAVNSLAPWPILLLPWLLFPVLLVMRRK